MEEYQLQFQAKISKKQAIEKICVHAMYGNHGNSNRPRSKKEVYCYYRNRGQNPLELAEICRNPSERIPEFENLLGSTWEAIGDVSSVDKKDGEEVFKMKGPGKFVWSTYEAHFEAACAARDRAVKECSSAAFHECLSQGFASIDAFLNMQAKIWNKHHPEDRLTDSETSKVSFETKIDEWIPKISAGGKLDKASTVWDDFKVLKRFRDENAIHPKSPASGIPYRKLADYINTFRFGIALFLGTLHRLLGRPIPAVIINAVYMPDVEMIKLPKG